jgi:glucose-6-phosphate isomerase
VEERDIQEVFTDIVNIGGGSDLGPPWLLKHCSFKKTT